MYSKQVWKESSQSYIKELNEDGLTEFNRWIKEESDAFSLLAVPYKSIYNLALRTLETDILKQASQMALWKSLLKFDPTKGSFSTVLTKTILGEITKCLRESVIDRVCNLFIQIDSYDSFKTNKTKKMTWGYLTKKSKLVIGTSLPDNPADICEKKDSINKIRKVLSSLDEDEQLLINKRIFEEQPWININTELSIPGNINRFEKLKEKLRNKFNLEDILV